MAKAQLVAIFAARQPHLAPADVDEATQHVPGQVSEALASGERVEVRGFGCFVLHYRQQRMGRKVRVCASA